MREDWGNESRGNFFNFILRPDLTQIKSQRIKDKCLRINIQKTLIIKALIIENWSGHRQSGRWDLNPRPQRPERCALARLRYSPEASNYKLSSLICPAIRARENGGDLVI